MMRNDYIIYALLVIVILGLISSVAGMVGYNSLKPVSVSQSTSNFEMKSTGTTGNGDVQVDLQPFGFQDGKFMVNLAIDTHSVDLSQFDLTKITKLEHNDKVIAPISAPSLAGHHSSGSLVFNMNENLQKFKITISGIPAVQDRIYEWQ